MMQCGGSLAAAASHTFHTCVHKAMHLLAQLEVLYVCGSKTCLILCEMQDLQAQF